ncbi:MAG: AmmeMemoRadiSam system radical SAM enzyme [Candidatus Omnitrophica bacterium]|nr:AmmeMemoRadiSam system radical SAM enzyme [Candidatus Omnitrophota bacterium]
MVKCFLCLMALVYVTAAVPVWGAEASCEALYWEKKEHNNVQCKLCPRQCVISSGNRGYCGVRVNKDGTLYTLGYNNPVAVHPDPIEKKPFFHVLPGTCALSLAVAGCNMRCLFCQNWQISQSTPDTTNNLDLTADEVVARALQYKCPSVVFTYTEPTVFYEYMLEIAKKATQQGLRVGMHSCGYINPAPLVELLDYMDFVNIDLKGFSSEFYRDISGGTELENVLRTLEIIHQAGVHLEITTLLIPTLNDSSGEIRALSSWIKENLGEETPLHFSRFQPQYKLQNLPATPLSTLRNAYDIAKEVGLKYVYIGNVSGINEESTWCPVCGKRLIHRIGYSVIENKIAGGRCPFCQTKIKGVWSP